MARITISFLLIEDDQLACAMCHKRMNWEEVRVLMKKELTLSTPHEQAWIPQNVFCDECAPIICKEEGGIVMQWSSY